MDAYDPYLGKILKRASYFSIGVALILVVVKFFTWQMTHSVSIRATFMDSVLDVLASLVNWFAIKHSLKPSDREHQFGHGKIEALAGLGQSVFIAISALFIVKESIQRLSDPQPIENSEIGIMVMIFSIILTIIFVSYQNFVIKKTNSLAISGDSLHYKSDILINLGVIFSLLVSRWAFTYFIDGLVAFGISLYIFYTAYKIGREGVDILMDKELSDEDREKIIILTIKDKDVLGIKALKTRKAGPFLFIQMDLRMNESFTLKEAHMIAHRVEQNLLKDFPTATITIHQEAVSHA